MIGANVTYVSAGVCTITASQSGDDSYQPAADITRSFNITVPDSDGDGIVDDNDNCPLVSNVDQTDSDSDDQGNACDIDDDDDGVADSSDNCPLVSKTDQADTEGDKTGDAWSDDSDGDSELNGDDN